MAPPATAPRPLARALFLAALALALDALLLALGLGGGRALLASPPRWRCSGSGVSPDWRSRG